MCQEHEGQPLERNAPPLLIPKASAVPFLLNLRLSASLESLIIPPHLRTLSLSFLPSLHPRLAWIIILFLFLSLF